MCLGGPNFDPLSVDELKLKSQGFDDEDLKLASDSLCLNVWKGGPITYANHPTLGKIPWSDEGYSERILKRKLQVSGISLNLGTLIMHPFFVIIIRYPLLPLCNFLGPDNHIGWIRTRQTVSHGQYFGCRNFIDEFTKLHLQNYSSCDKNKDILHQTCLLDRSISDWNFMPFRLRFKPLRHNLCWTQKLDGSLSLLPCSNYHFHEGIPNVNISYAAPQLFHMFPLKNKPQLIKNLGIFDSPHGKNHDQVTCLTAGEIVANHRKLSMSSCHEGLHQQFIVSMKDSGLPDKIASTNHLVPAVAITSIKWMDENNYEYCVSLVGSNLKSILASESVPLVLQLCNLTHTKKKNNQGGGFKSEFFLEKTFTEGPKLSPLYNMQRYTPGKETVAKKIVDDEKSNDYDRTGLVDVLKTDDGQSRFKKKRKSKSSNQRKSKGGNRKTKPSKRDSSSALLPQKLQGKKSRGGKKGQPNFVI